MTSHFHLLHSCGTHEQRARAGARASVDLAPLWRSASTWKRSPRLLRHQRTDLSERGMQSLLLTNWSASTLHSRVDVFCCLAILPSLARVYSTFASSTKPGQDHR